MSETIEQLKTRAAALSRAAHLTNDQIDVVNDVAWRLRFADISLVVDLSAQALKHATRNDYLRGRAYALRGLGLSHLYKDQYQEAEQKYEESRRLFLLLEDDAGLALVVNGLGAIKVLVGDYEAAVEIHETALGLREKLSDWTGVAGIMLNFGIINSRLGEYGQALDYNYRGLQTAIDCESSVYQAHAFGNIGDLLWRVGEATESIRCSRQALTLFETHPDQRGECMTLSNLAAAQHSCGEHKRALENYHLSLSLSKAIGNVETQADVNLGIGAICAEMNDVESALAHFFEALQLAQNTGNRFFESQALLALGRIYRQKGNLQQGFQLLEKALEISEELSIKEVRYKTHLALSESFEQAGKTAAALAHYRRFHHCYQEIFGARQMRRVQQVLWQNQSGATTDANRKNSNLMSRQLLRLYAAQQPMNEQRLAGFQRRAHELPPRKLQKVIAFIKQNLEHNLGTADIAAEASLSRHHFSKLFKQSTGRSPHQYLLEQRIKRAKHLLAATNLPLAEIALQCGFSSQAHLATQFRVNVGITPVKFRAAL